MTTITTTVNVATARYATHKKPCSCDAHLGDRVQPAVTKRNAGLKSWK